MQNTETINTPITFEAVVDGQDKNTELSSINQNSLLSAAMPLLVFIVNLRNATSCGDINELHTKLIAELELFEYQAKLLGHDHRCILAARYCLCTALDETVLNTKWGNDSIWVQQSLLALLHNETWGGQRFYVIIKKMSEEAEKNLDLLELLYFILSLGFEGKYYNDTNKRDMIRDNLFHTISAHKVENKEFLTGKQEQSNVFKEFRYKNSIPVWVLAAFTLGILFFTTLTYQFSLQKSTAPTLKELKDNSPILVANTTDNDRPIS